MKVLSCRLLVLAALCAESAAGAGAHPRARDPALIRARAMAADIQASVSRVRGLTIRRRLRVGIHDRAELRRLVRGELTRAQGARRLEATGDMLRLLGLAPASWGMRRGFVELLEEQVGGLYDPRTKRLRVMRRMIVTGPVSSIRRLLLGDPEDEARLVMAHEITHALQDQHYRLDRMARDRPHDTDLETAVASLVEGDATAAMMAWFMAEKGRGGASELFAAELFAAGTAIGTMLELLMKIARVGLLPDSAALARSPRWLQDRLTTPYIAGLTMCIRAGSFAGVDRLYRAPPLSTEQVLHPERLLGHRRDDPIRLRTPDLSRILGRGWKRTWYDVLGELGTRSLFAVEEGDADAERRAAGWGGDRWDLYARGRSRALAWMATWDNLHEAEEAFAGLRKWASVGGTRFVKLVGADTVAMVGIARPLCEKASARLLGGTRRRRMRRLPR